MGYQLARPPLIDTDLTTNENFHTGTIVGTSPVGTRHHYSTYSQGITGLALSPTGHGKGIFAGIWATYQAMDSSTNGNPAMRLAFRHQPASIQEYSSGWEDAMLLASVAPAPGYSAFTVADIAAQRLGDYVYVFSASMTVAGTGHFTMRRIGPNKAISTRMSFDVVNLMRIPIPGFASQVQHQFFVSDDAVPFIWSTFGDVSQLWPGGSGSASGSYSYYPVGYCAFADNGAANPGTMGLSATGQIQATGQLGAYLQVGTLPSRVYAFGPSIVFPWRSGNYGHPELWYFVMNGTGRTAVYDIYAAKWARNNYQRIPNVTLVDDAAFQSASRRFPAGNPDGWAFDSNWYKPGNKVARIGPFDADVWNQNAQRIGVTQQMRWPAFRVLRDAHRVGQLHFVLANNGGLVP